MRLERWVSTWSALSRKQARAVIKAGRVRVDGAVCRDGRLDVSGEQVTLDGAPLLPPPLAVRYHKPLGVVSTVTDPWGRPCLGDAVPGLLEQGLHPVGRLDADTDGLLLFSSDGALTQRLLHPRHGVQKVYRATVEPPADASLIPMLSEGVETAEGRHTAEVRSLDGADVVLAVTEGKHRMVRRMLANAGHPVVALRRLSFGPLVLGDLEAGAWRPVTDEEHRQLVTLRDGPGV